MFVAITREMSHQTLRDWQALIGSLQSPVEQIRRIAREFPNHIRQNEDAYHVLHGALATSNDRKVLAVMKEHYSGIEKFFCKIVQDGQKEGVFMKNLDPKLPAWQLINLGIGYAMIALNLQQFDHFSVEDSVEFILRGLKG
jgi:hypothetical protein